jgi:hypothetical protein
MKNKTILVPPPIHNITSDSILQNVTNMTSHGNHDDEPKFVPLVRDETRLEYISDFVLGIAFLIIGVIAAKR